MTDDQAAELIGYVRDMSGAFTSIAKTLELDYNRRYPSKKEPRDIDLHYIKTDEEELKESLGDTGEATLTDWTTIGPRERAFREKEAENQRRATAEVKNNGSR